LSGSGFRRYATYRQAAMASIVTNTMFGFLRTFVLTAVAATAGAVAGYDTSKLITFVWLGQGLLGVIGVWGWNDLADRVRTGNVVVDLLRPIHPVTNYLAVDLGRAGYAMLVRFVLPVLTAALFFDMYWPRHSWTYPLFALSVGLGVLVSFACRYLVNATSFWLLDSRGVNLLWGLTSGVLSGLVFPLRFLPGWAQAVLIYGTPFPSMMQAPIDVAVERVPGGQALGLVALQAGWAVALLAGCALTQRRAEHRMVIQGG
jgi:ABC-2 type transport system permease protein